jgi:hypothetical protein
VLSPAAEPFFVGAVSTDRAKVKWWIDYSNDSDDDDTDEVINTVEVGVAFQTRYLLTPSFVALLRHQSLLSLVDKEALVLPFSPGSTLEPGLKGFHHVATNAMSAHSF